MAKYSHDERQANRKTITKGTFWVLALLAILTALQVISVRTGLGWLALTVGFAAVLWWLFAAKAAGNINGTWVDGWVVRFRPGKHDDGP